MATTKNTVIINGITLTREQVEAAIEELGAPTRRRVTFDENSGCLKASNTDVAINELQHRAGGTQKKQGVYLPSDARSLDGDGGRYPITWSVIRDNTGCFILIGEYTR